MARTKVIHAGCVALILLGACSHPPGLDSGPRIPPSDQPVVLLPLNEVLAQAGGGDATDASAAALAARAASLRARVGANN